MAFYIAQTISVLTAISAVIMMQFKNIKGILAGQIITNLLSATTYFLLGGLSGAGVCLVAIVQSVVMFCYSLNAHKPHLAVSITFIVAYLGCSVLYYQSPIDVLSAVAAVCFAISIVQTKSSTSRLWYLFNPLLWIVYDIFTSAYVNIVVHFAVFVSTLIAIVRLDVLKAKGIKPRS